VTERTERNDVLEEAAKVADALAEAYPSEPRWAGADKDLYLSERHTRSIVLNLQRVAYRIRELKEMAQ
jgi:hypothetical protein